LLPKYRGAAPINRSIQAGEREVGVSVILIEPQVDSGPIVAADSYTPSLEDTAVEIEDHLSKLGAPLTLRAIDEIESGDIKPLPQSHEEATRTPKLRKEEGRIDWSKPSLAIINQYRAFQPWPRTYNDWTNSASSKVVRLILGPFSTVDSQGAKYQLSEKEKTLSPGSVLSASKDGLWIRTGDGALRVIAVQPAGKKNQPVEAFVQGYPIKVGDILE
jgi:methionyl-tRNA formyltransferase